MKRIRAPKPIVSGGVSSGTPLPAGEGGGGDAIEARTTSSLGFDRSLTIRADLFLCRAPTEDWVSIAEEKK